MTSDRNEWNRFRKDNTRAGPVAPYSDGRRIRAAMFRAAMPRLSCGRIERSFRREKKATLFRSFESIVTIFNHRIDFNVNSS